ncbi:MAG: acyl-CoA reductase [Polyangiaceae bacterium]
MTRDERIAAVQKLLDAAREVVSARAFIAPAIVESTGLSREGVELALTEHVEVDATPGDVAALVDRAGDHPEVRVILSANVFVGALRALALARAAAPRVWVRPSRRDPTFARALVSAAKDDAITLVDELDPASVSEGVIHVYGRDDTIADVRAKARVPVVGHASGMGVAWVPPDADIAAAARALARDVVPFDQRGCLSPRMALVCGEERASELAQRLHDELEALSASVPRGPLPSEERAASGRYVATMTYACSVLVGSQHAVGLGPLGAPLVLPPVYRHVHVAPCRDAEHARELTRPFERAVISVGAHSREAAGQIAPAWARRAELGRMQRPQLDGPVDLRVG